MRQMSVTDRLGFLFHSSVVVRFHAGEHSYRLEEFTCGFQPMLLEPSNISRQFEDEARAIGEKLASEGGFRAMTDAMDAVEVLHGLNAGEWIARRWDGIPVGDGEWIS